MASLSRGSVGSYSSQKPTPSTVGCNRCRKSLTTTLFVCTCDCVFCEACTYDHFQSSSDCPSCGRQLGQNDFLELTVSDPSTASRESLKNTFQTLFTKFSARSTVVSHREMCLRILRSMDDDRRAVKFLMKQFVEDANAEGARSTNLGSENAQLKQEIARMKQAASSERTNFEQVVNELKARVQGMGANVSSLQRKVQEHQLAIREKDAQLSQFREMFANQGQASVPSSSHSSHSGGRRGPTPFVLQQQQRQQEKHRHEDAQGRGQSKALQALLGRDQVPMSSVGITPIQVPRSRSANNPPFRRPSGPSPGGQMGSSSLPPTPRIRDFTSSSGYRFTDSSRGAGSGGHNHHLNSKRQRMDSSRNSSQQYHNNGIPGFGRR